MKVETQLPKHGKPALTTRDSRTCNADTGIHFGQRVTVTIREVLSSTCLIGIALEGEFLQLYNFNFKYIQFLPRAKELHYSPSPRRKESLSGR